jgi:hypothetical protein
MSDSPRAATPSPTAEPPPPAPAPAAEAPTGAAPPFRRLRAYAFDPSLNIQLDTAVINQVTLQVPWEEGLKPGPVGEYVEVVDYDPAGGCYYEPVDLNRPDLLARDGLAPSEGNPQFHQQMVYAVAMTTIRQFEQALGRPALWAARAHNQLGPGEEAYVPRLRIYPHALREANAYYSPEKKALLFGYFPASRSDPGHNLPGGMVFTCLSHDVVAHETTHALLDGMERRFAEPSNPDPLAFHEAFADIVALFQHFTLPNVLRHQIAQTRGDLAAQNLLGKLAVQFGEALGSHGALRDAIGEIDPATHAWQPHKPDPADYQNTQEPHARGSILVAAVFDAFLSIYESRVADLLRIASGGSGVLRPGSLHPDLVNRLAQEAAKSAQHVLRMCIRALDYCPPVDLTFGDYLRALITADFDLVPDDDLGYRVAFIEAFRRRGIYPEGIRTLSIDSLRWPDPTPEQRAFFRSLPEAAWEVVKDSVVQTQRVQANMSECRKAVFDDMRRRAAQLHQILKNGIKAAPAGANGQANPGKPLGLDLSAGAPPFEVHSVRPCRRIGPDGQYILEFLISINQRRPGFFSDRTTPLKKGEAPDFWFRGGCNLLVDWTKQKVRYCIARDINDPIRYQRQQQYLGRPAGQSLRATYFGQPCGRSAEPFALLHREA